MPVSDVDFRNDVMGTLSRFVRVQRRYDGVSCVVTMWLCLVGSDDVFVVKSLWLYGK